jgi:1-acyl-sn-glycerol-3-phosphate acyltransferase
MSLIRQFSRIPLLLAWVLAGTAWIRGALWWDRWRGQPWHTGAARRAQAHWCRILCIMLGLRLRLTGHEIAQGPALLVSNHISWLDITCVAAHWPVAFLSKSEVRKWPLIGSVASGLGTLYIDRGGRDAASAAAAQMRERLASGERVLFFPEGTTSDGTGLLPFRPRLFQAAIDSGSLVQPLTLSYHRADGTLSDEAPFIDAVPLLRQVWRLTRVACLEVRIHVGESIEAAGRGRSELARLTREAIARRHPGGSVSDDLLGVPVPQES